MFLKIRAALGIGLTLVVLMVSACAAPTTAPASATTASAAPSGKLTVYTSIQPDMLKEIEPVVKQKMPGVEVTFFQAGTEKLVAKLAAEMEAGKVGADVLMVADPAYYLFLKSKEMLLPHKPANTAGLLGFQDLDGYFSSVRIINGVIGYNTKLVKAADAPTKFSDLKDPKWKNKLGMPDPTLSGSAFGTVAALANKYGWDYFKAMKDNKIFIADGQGTLEKKLVSGEVAVAIILETNILIAKDRGDPVELIYPEDGVVVLPSPIGIIKTTANPNAAKAMVDFWFTQEGQETIVKGWMHSVRSDLQPPKGALSLAEFSKRQLPVDWQKLAFEIGPLKDAFTKVMQP